MKKLITLICACLLMVSSVNIGYAFDEEDKDSNKIGNWHKKNAGQYQKWIGKSRRARQYNKMLSKTQQLKVVSPAKKVLTNEISTEKTFLYKKDWLEPREGGPAFERKGYIMVYKEGNLTIEEYYDLGGNRVESEDRSYLPPEPYNSERDSFEAAGSKPGPLPYNPDHSIVSEDVPFNNDPGDQIVVKENETAVRKGIEQKKSEKLPEGITICGQMAAKKQVLPQLQK